MPYKPKRPCAYPSCGRLAEREQYCAEHQKVVDKQYNQYERDPKSNKRYGRSWKRIRDRYITTGGELGKIAGAQAFRTGALLGA